MDGSVVNIDRGFIDWSLCDEGITTAMRRLINIINYYHECFNLLITLYFSTLIPTFKISHYYALYSVSQTID